MNRLLLSATVLIAAGAARADEKINVLIIDGQNNHNWRQTTPHMKKWLEASGRFKVDVATAPTMPRGPQKPKADANEEAQRAFARDQLIHEAKLNTYRKSMETFRPDFSKYAVVVSNYNGDSWPKETNAALEQALSSGRLGLVIVHAANNSFPGRWKEYDQMIGMGWRDNKYGDRLKVDDDGKAVRVPKGEGPGASHGPMHPFKIVVRDKEHLITKGMPAEWMHANDELYHGMRGPVENVHLLATAYADKNKGGTGEHEPMIWTVAYGKGRVFHTPMGHDVGSMHCVGFIAALQRGTEWAATGGVTIPLPEKFPTGDAVRTVPAK